MPTPVTTARQCLTEEAARVLDDAVAVARRRNHAHTTSLHVVSALLAMPTSSLRDACARAHGGASYSTRLQFRALELSVGVSLDRISSSKISSADTEDPPVSNSLMAAIKRSQANQRRHPDSYHLQQLNNAAAAASATTQTASVLKVEIKYFILSILDDPNVSQVLGKAGFNSCDIKIAVLHPPVAQFSPRLTRYPPIFLCNLPNSDPVRMGFNLPFLPSEPDENSRRIGEVFIRKNRRNPLLVGKCAGEALKSFVESIERGQTGCLPDEVSGLSLISFKNEFRELINSGSEEKVSVKVKELEHIIDHRCPCSVLNLGELEVLIRDDASSSISSLLVSKLTKLLETRKEKLWLIGTFSSSEMYSNFLDRFPAIEEEWDLNLLPITSSKTPLHGPYSKSSLMASFVPFGGFFSTSSDFQNRLSSSNQSVDRCQLCNDKYEQELKGGTIGSVYDQGSDKLPSWLRTEEPNTDKVVDLVAKDDISRISTLQTKWNNICHRLHQNQATTHFPVTKTFHASYGNQNFARNQLLNINRCSSLNPIMQIPVSLASTPKNISSLSDQAQSFSSSCVSTDLGLGSLYASTSQDSITPKSQEPGGFKTLMRFLAEKVRWQTEAIVTISEAISLCRTGTAPKTVWLAFLGPDRVGKLKTASALAEIVFGSRDSLISVNFDDQDSNSMFKCKNLRGKLRGKTVIDYITSELTKKPQSVVLLENIDKAEYPDQISLSEAVRTGKLRDTHGREIRTNDVIFVATTGNLKSEDTNIKYTEEQILKAKSWQMQIEIEETSNPEFTNKRRKKSRSYLDLNVPLEDSVFSKSRTWLDDFLKTVNQKIEFKPFSFDKITEKVEKTILSHFRRSFGPETALSIDQEVEIQIFAAAWLSWDNENAVENWLEHVLGRKFEEVREKCNLSSISVVRLVSCEGRAIEEQHSGICLPANIILK